MNAHLRLFLAAAVLLIGLGASGGTLDEVRPKPPSKLPRFVSPKPLYGVFLFGKEKPTAVWAVLDRIKRDSESYDVLYIDLNADGDLTAANERFAGVPPVRIDEELRSTFTIGKFTDPVSSSIHTDFSITWRANRVSYKMKWNGNQITMGGFGTDPDTYGNFSDSPNKAPVLVPGHDRPFQFQHWMSGSLKMSRENDFKLFMGNPGSGPGTFSCVDDTFLPKADFVFATLIYKDKAGAQHQMKYELRQRC